MPFYETMYLVHPSVDDERLAEIIARYNQVVESAGGVIEYAGKWDRRRLAYPINKVQEATYVLVYFRADQKVPAELDRLFRISDEVIRHLIIRHDKPHLVLTVPSTSEEAEEEWSEIPEDVPPTEPESDEDLASKTAEPEPPVEGEEPASAEEEKEDITPD